jgi:capsular exopolysaccharide synthesis family protein
VGITYLTPKTYASSATIFVSISSTADKPGDLYQNSQFALNRVASYIEIVHSPALLNHVIDDLDLGISVAKLDGMVTATNPADTVLITVRSTSDNASEARRIADAVASELGDTIEKLEQPANQNASPVQVTTVVPARQPAGPVSPRPALNLALGLLLGLALGAAIAMIREQLDTRVKTGRDLQRITGRTPLGLIGYDSAIKKHPLVVTRGKGTILEDFRSIRTNLQFVSSNGPARVIVMSSANAGEGKSVTAANLAITIAQGGNSVCLIEGDLRNPKATTYFGVDGAVGLTDVVSGQHDLEDALVRWNPGQIALLPAGPTPPDPGQLLGSSATASVLARLRNQFDVILIDAPPLIPVSDAAVLGRSADGIILVVRHSKTRREQITTITEQLAAANVRLLGTILTQVPARARKDGHEYGYQAGESSTPLVTQDVWDSAGS